MAKRMTRIAGVLALTAALGLAPAYATASSEAVTAGPCLGNADGGGEITGGPGNVYLPSASGIYKTTNRCRDINFRSFSRSGDEPLEANIRVCFVRAGYCQSSWKYYFGDRGDWMVIASNVKDGTWFRVEFQFYASSFRSKYDTLIAF